MTVCIQSENEVSLFPTAPGTDRSPTLDLYDKNRTALVEELRVAGGPRLRVGDVSPGALLTRSA